MGGGLELAWAATTVWAPGRQVALPESELGILPGAGGTQRPARVVGVEGRNMIVSGRPNQGKMIGAVPRPKLFDR